MHLREGSGFSKENKRSPFFSYDSIYLDLFYTVNIYILLLVYFNQLTSLVIFGALGLASRASSTLDKQSTTEGQPQPAVCILAVYSCS